jgi:hypothetical protein
MTRAEDAVEIHTDDVHPQSVIARIVELARERGARRVCDDLSRRT